MSRLLLGVNDLASQCPELLKEWDYDKNAIRPEEITSGSNRKVWWLCEKGHSWEANISNRKKGRGCPFCSGKRVIEGENDLCSLRPDLIKEWDFEKNTIKPTEISAGSNKRVWWKCSKGHEWEVKICSRVTLDTGCPYCSGRRAISGETDLATKHPELASEWNYNRNTVTPSEVSSCSGKKFWWICPQGHEYDAVVYDRINGNGCPYCAGKRVLKGYNDLATQYPDMAKEWDFERNAFGPEEITTGSHKKVWWKCSKCGFSWKAVIYSRKNGNGCPGCSEEKRLLNHQEALLKNHGSLYENNKAVLSEWDYSKNTVKPTEVTAGSGIKAWWICNKGHSYIQRIDHKTSGIGCPICAREQSSSFPEQAVFYYIKQFFQDAVNGDRTLISPLELDIYIPEKRIAIEYDGMPFHKDIDRDLIKNRKCRDNNIELIRIRDENCPVIKEGKQYRHSFGDYDVLEEIIKDILRYLGIHKADINIERDTSEILSSYLNKIKENSFAFLYPDLLKEWDYERNGSLDPYTVPFGSNKKVWWVCNKGHEWQAAVSNRRINSCPICSNKKLLMGYNDFATLNPDLMNEWNYSRNDQLGIDPTKILGANGTRVWWICARGHEWEATLNSRSTKKCGCPYCSGLRPIEGETDFATMYKSLLDEWDYNKNTIYPNEVSGGSNSKIWWKCKKSHSYLASVVSRTRGGGCPVCANKKVVPGYNDLSSQYPELMSEWDYIRNNAEGIFPDSVTSQSGKKVWWICNKGHSYNATVSSRTRKDGKNTGCPICSNNMVITGFNDLCTTHPELVKEWNYEKNDKSGILPTKILAGSAKKVWWKCNKDHEWEAALNSRSLSKRGCPYCSGRNAIEGETDLATTHPEMLAKWDYERNTVQPTEVKAGSGKKFHWICPQGHRWIKRMQDAVRSNLCPICKV